MLGGSEMLKNALHKRLEEIKPQIHEPLKIRELQVNSRTAQEPEPAKYIPDSSWDEG